MHVILIIAFLVILALGILYVVILRGTPKTSSAWRGVARTSIVAGIISVVLTALAAIISFTSVLEASLLNTPLAIATFLAIPVALVGIGCGVIGLKSDARIRALVGLALSATFIIAWTIMESFVS